MGEGITGLSKPLNTGQFTAGLSEEALLTFIKTGRRLPSRAGVWLLPPKGGNPALTNEGM
ncbi:MAG: hypothetical protein HYR94_03790 [Chloroflexi bacterium]|nr:hypothetical protein [Chloroflexota bacterium]